jgi:membrane-bound inhibitor of C-type lysozyme
MTRTKSNPEMTSSLKHWFLLVGALALCSCAIGEEGCPSVTTASGATSSETSGDYKANKTAPTRTFNQYACRSGAHFEIKFTRNKEGVVLNINGSNAPILLKNTGVGSGVEYEGNGYVFREYKQIITLTSSKGTSRCHLLPRSFQIPQNS